MPRPQDEAEYGPTGFLPERAAKRARKIVLREPMGLQWPIAAGVAAVLLAVVAIAYLLSQTGPPGSPFVAAGPIDRVDPRGAATVTVGEIEALVVRGGGGVEVFAAPDIGVTWCATSKHIESGSGQVWTLDGRLIGGTGDSLRPLRAQVVDGVLYVDPVTDLPVRAPQPSGTEPACA